MPPSDAKLERALRNAVVKCFETGDMDSLTVKRVREGVAVRLGLPSDFFKTHGTWNQKSKDIVTDEVEKQEPGPEPQNNEEDDDVPVQGHVPSTSSRSKTASDESDVKESPSPSAVSKKRKSHPTYEQKARRKRQKSTPLESEDEASEARHDESDVSSIAKSPPPAQTPKEKKTTSEANDESEMSDVIVESPPRKGKKRSPLSDGPAKQKKATSKPAVKPKKESSATPQEEEIKKLQSWLVKCGIRKVWGSYLKAYDTPRAKISHLKEMLSDVGMDGRFSEEKARRIKERRELAADLEAVKEGEKSWGIDEGAEEGGKPKRRLAKGLAELAQFDDSDSDSD